MPPTQSKHLLVVCLLSLVGLGSSCGESDTADNGDAPATDASAPAYANCPDVPEFHLGLSQLGEQGLVKASIESATPATPQKYENAWVVKLTDPDGAPIPGLELYEVQPFMPEHGHDGTFAPELSAGDGDGVYEVKRINLWMKDTWEVRLFVHVDAKHDDKIVFQVCIPP